MVNSKNLFLLVIMVVCSLLGHFVQFALPMNDPAAAGLVTLFFTVELSCLCVFGFDVMTKGVF